MHSIDDKYRFNGETDLDKADRLTSKYLFNGETDHSRPLDTIYKFNGERDSD